MNKKKLSIGTAQFLEGYGIGKNKKLNKKKIIEIFNLCENYGINNLDTAVVYGPAEKILGKFNLKAWNVTSKVNKVPLGVDVEKFIKTQVEISLKNLNIDYLDVLLLHNPMQLNTSIGDKIYNILNKLIEESKILSFGYSVYSPEEFLKIHKLFKSQVCQIPFNILDSSINLFNIL